MNQLIALSKLPNSHEKQIGEHNVHPQFPQFTQPSIHDSAPHHSSMQTGIQQAAGEQKRQLAMLYVNKLLIYYKQCRVEFI